MRRSAGSTGQAGADERIIRLVGTVIEIGVRPPRFTPLRFGSLDVLVLPESAAASVWVAEGGGSRRLLLSEDELQWDASGRARVKAVGTPAVRVYTLEARSFTALPLTNAPAPPVAAVAVEQVRPAAAAVPVSYGKHEGRPSAPTPEVFAELAAAYRLNLPSWAADPACDALLRIDWAGDVGELRIDGVAVTDRFWDGSRWIVNLPDVGYRPGAEVTLHVLPLAAGSPVHLPADARERLAAVDNQLLEITRVEVVARTAAVEA